MSATETAAMLATACEAARRAGEVLKTRFHAARTIDFKGGARNNLVTDADKASEAVLLEYLKSQWPAHGIISEESGASGEERRVVWHVDPLDGTTNYAHRVPHFCVSIAAADEAGPRVGVVFDPLRDELFAAARGQGASLNGTSINVSTTQTLDTALLCTGFPYNLLTHPNNPLDLFVRVVKRAQGIRRMGSAALDLAYVACGRYDGFFEYGLKSWDTAAGALLVTEAGGVVKSLNGQPYQTHCPDILCSCPGIAEALHSATK